jgi:outer membrane protein assembly factor BamB
MNSVITSGGFVMRNARLLLGSLMVCLLLVTAAAAQDWPQWRGPNRDGKATGFTAPETWPAALTQQWRVVVGTGDATPALVGDKLYVFSRQGEEEVTTCLNVADGTQVWQDKVAAAPATGPGARHPGPRSSVAVAEGKVLTLGVAGVLSCLDAGTGALVWRKDPFPGVVPRFFTSSSPLIVNGMAIAHLGGPGNGALIGFDLATGEEMGRWGNEGPDYASPVLMTVADTPQVVTMTEKSVVGVSLLDGTLLWQLPFVPEGRAYNSSTPVVDGQIVYYTGSQRGIHAVKIEKQGETFTATELWANPDLACQYCTPVLRDGFLYGVSDKGNLFCLNAGTGQPAWVDEGQTDKGSYAPMVDAGGVLMALPSSGELIVFKADSTAFTQLGRYKVADTPVYAYPIVAGKQIIVKDQDAVTAWQLP